MLTLRPVGQNDYNVREGGQTIGRIRYASERTPGIWLWNIQVHVTTGLPMGSAKDLETAKAEFKTAWEALKVRVGPEALAKAFAAMNIREGG